MRIPHENLHPGAATWALRILTAMLAFACPAHLVLAADPLPTPDYSGDIWTRSTLTGDWGGARNELAKKGLTLDITYAQIYQGIVHGGRNENWSFGGRGQIDLLFDTGKAGLWPGGFLSLEGEGDWGTFSNFNSGALLPVDNNGLYPVPGERDFVLPQVRYTQFLSEQFGVFLGQVDTTGGDDNAFAHGKGAEQFLNFGFGFNPVYITTVPYSALGAGLIYMPNKDFVATISILDAEGRADACGFSTVFKGGTVYAAQGRYTTRFFGLTGHQLVGGTYSDKVFRTLDQRFGSILGFRPFEVQSGSWSAYYNFDQYLWQPDPSKDRGIGIFGRLGGSDGTANPIHWFGSFGVGGKGMIPGRAYDQFGVGYYYVSTSNANTLSFLRLGDEQGWEAYYEFAITPWCHLTPDIQVIHPSQERLDTSVALGVRMMVKF